MTCSTGARTVRSAVATTWLMPSILPLPTADTAPGHGPVGQLTGWPERRGGYRSMVTAPLSLARSGAGEPLLLLHGWGSSRRDFAAVLPALTERFDVLNVDLPGAGRSRHLDVRPTVAAITDAVERTLDAQDVGRVHVLGNSLGARIALELARRGRAPSVVSIAPSGLNIWPERVFQGTGMAVARLVGRTAAPLIGPLSRSALGRTALLLPLKARPWSTSREEAIGVARGLRRLARLLAHAALGAAARRPARPRTASTAPCCWCRGPRTGSRWARPSAISRWFPGPGSGRCWRPATRRSPTGRRRS